MADVDEKTEAVGQPQQESSSSAGPIPMCTLFNPSSNNSDLTTEHLPSSQQSKPTQLATPTESTLGVSSTLEQPVLCNIFKTNSTSNDDIFSHLNDDQQKKSNPPSIQSLADSKVDSLAPMESLRLNLSVDSFEIGDLAESDDPTIDSGQVGATLGGPGVTQSLDPSIKSSPSFVSITSFSISPDEMNEQPATDTIVDEQASLLGKLTLEEGEPLALNASQNDGADSPSLEGNSVPTESNIMNELIVTPSIENVTTGPEIKQESNENSEIQMPPTYETNHGKEVTDNSDISEHDNQLQIAVIHQAENEIPKSQENPTSKSLFVMEQSDKSGLFSPSTRKTGIFEDEDDPFAAALINSELDRRRDAWIPSQNTKQVLKAVMTSQKAIKLEAESLTRPGLSTSELLEDPVKELVVRMTGSESIIRRENLTLSDVNHNRDGLKQLIDSGNLRAASNLCAKLLSDHGQGFGKATHVTTSTAETLQLWFTRIFLLIQLKLFEAAAVELSNFKDLDNPDLYFEFYPDMYPGRRGSIVPFSFRLLHAEFPQYVEKPQESLKRLHAILAACKTILENLGNGKNEIGDMVALKQSDREVSVDFWKERKVNTLFAIGNTLVQLKDYGLAAEVYSRVLQLKPEKTVDIQSGIGRIYLELGDVRAAQLRFTEAEKAGINDSKYKVQLILNRGFMYIGTNNWKEAHTQFEMALGIEPNSTVALNNKAVCLLYMGRLKDAISILEKGMLQEHASDKDINVCWQQDMTQGLLSNLSTLYELESSRYVMKKRALFLKHIAPKCGDSFDTACLKEI